MAEKAAPLPLSAVPMEEKKKHAPADPPPPFPGVRHVIIWALLNAGHVAFTIAYALVMPSWMRPRTRPGPVVEVTDAELEVAAALAAGMLSCVVSQAAAGALALMLPRRRCRRLRLILAYAALVATAAGHSMWAVLDGMFVAEDGGLCFWTSVTTAVIFFLGVGDFLCFRGLVLRGGEEEDEE